MSLDHLSKEEVLELNIPNGVPIVYEYDGSMLVSKTML
jgi:bisphosphoglycerate-dependent phosphoglycerate mutase